MSPSEDTSQAMPPLSVDFDGDPCRPGILDTFLGGKRLGFLLSKYPSRSVRMTTGLMRAHTSICVFSAAAFFAGLLGAVFAGLLGPVLADGNLNCIIMKDDNDR